MEELTIKYEMKSMMEAVSNLTAFSVLQEFFEKVNSIMSDIKDAYYEEKVEQYYDKNKRCLVKKVYYASPNGKRHHDVYDCYYPPPKEKDKSKVLQKNKRRNSNHV